MRLYAVWWCEDEANDGDVWVMTEDTSSAAAAAWSNELNNDVSSVTR